MTIFSCFSKSYEVLLEPWKTRLLTAEPTAQVLIGYSGIEAGSFGTESYLRVLQARNIFVLSQMQQLPQNELVLWLGLDCWVMKPFIERLTELAQNPNLFYMMDEGDGTGCVDCMVCRAGQAAALENVLFDNRYANDQLALNGRLGHLVRRLPRNEFFCVGPKLWTPEQPLPTFPEETRIFHANWTIGIENKRKLLQL